MFRTVGDQPTLWDAVLPDELLVLPAELARVDTLLDDPAEMIGVALLGPGWWCWQRRGERPRWV